MVVYLGASWILGISEAHHFIRVLKIATQKLGRPINIIWNWKL
jgi:hypothetical protein